jgi:putative transcriptional regulator
MNQGGIMSVHPIKIARVSKDLNQEALAKICNVSRQTIGLIEAGKFNPSLALCIKIAQALDKTLDDLFWPGPQDKGRKLMKKWINWLKTGEGGDERIEGINARTGYLSFILLIFSHCYPNNSPFCRPDGIKQPLRGLRDTLIH